MSRSRPQQPQDQLQNQHQSQIVDQNYANNILFMTMSTL
jgi:hypothetical protein